MRKLLIPTVLFAVVMSCSPGNGEPDAWGNFEATEIMIAPEISGKIITMMIDEGDILKEGDTIALIDKTMFLLQLNELEASAQSVLTRINSVDAQNRIMSQQIDNLRINLDRISKMLEEGAATRQQYDDLAGQIEVLKRQIEASNTQKTSIRSELSVLDSKKRQIEEQLSRCSIESPADGTVIQKYFEAGEICSAGRPVVKIADLTTMDLKVFVSGAHLSEIKIGDVCEVRIDEGEAGYRSFQGTISRIADKAEFTPKIIQTKEERVSLVYAVILKVQNDGSIKSGMPGEVIFNTTD